MTQERVEDVAVPNESKPLFPMGLWEFWSQWSEMATRMWTHREKEKTGGRTSTGSDRSYPSIDPFTLLDDWYTMMNKLWSHMAKESIPSEQLSAFTGPFLENHSRLISALLHASETYARAFYPPKSSDIARVAELVVNLEEKIDSIGDAIEHVKKQKKLDATTVETITNLEQRLSQIEHKLDTLAPRKKKSVREE